MGDEKKVLVLGAGPAGLMASHAAAMLGCDVRILSKKGRKSKMMGAQYLHAPIPGGISDDTAPFIVNYKIIGGTAEEYREKVYGSAYTGTVSPDELATTHVGWDIRTAYDRLWETYSPYVQDWDAVSPQSVAEALAGHAGVDLVVSTIPAPLLCHAGHTFGATTIFSSDQAMGEIENNTVLCNAAEAPRWYRAARIDGWDTVEWPGTGPKPPITPMWDVTKPTMTNCTCFPEITRSGRYGKWTKGVLSHDSFYHTYETIRDMA